MLTGTTDTDSRDTECGLFNNNINHAITEAWIDEGSPHLTIIHTSVLVLKYILALVLMEQVSLADLMVYFTLGIVLLVMLVIIEVLTHYHQNTRSTHIHTCTGGSWTVTVTRPESVRYDGLFLSTHTSGTHLRDYYGSSTDYHTYWANAFSHVIVGISWTGPEQYQQASVAGLFETRTPYNNLDLQIDRSSQSIRPLCVEPPYAYGAAT